IRSQEEMAMLMDLKTLQELEDNIDLMSEQELDALPFGAIRLDAEGTFLSYNARESELTGRAREKVIGRNFFTQVAPCTNVRDLAGRFRDGVARKEMHIVFPFRFDFDMAPRDVTVVLFYSHQTNNAWVFIREITTASLSARAARR